MKLFSNFDVIGEAVNLRRTNKNHMGRIIKQEKDDDIVTSFADTLNTALKKVNNQQMNYDNLQQKMVVEPHKVNIGQVMIAFQKAQFSLGFLKGIRDRVVRAYQNIINMR